MRCNIFGNTQAGLEKEERFGCVTIISYQKLIQMLERDPSLRLRYSYIFFDEIHYIVEDSTFSSKTGFLLSKMIAASINSVRVYMTATPQEIFPLIVDEEKRLSDYIDKYVMRVSTSKYNYFKHLKHYEFAFNYKFLNAYYFKDKQEIIDRIIQSHDKWIVFVDSIPRGKEFEELIPNSVLITADSKDSQKLDGIVYREILEQEKFVSCQILISTSVVGNGVNFIDKSLKNIAVFTSDRVSIVQQLGRRRIVDESDRVILYIHAKSLKNISNKLHLTYKKLAVISEFKGNQGDFTSFFNKYYTSDQNSHELAKDMFFFKNGKSILNCVLEHKLNLDKSYLEGIKVALDAGDDTAYVKSVLNLFKLKYNPRNWLSYEGDSENLQNFISFLENNVGVAVERDGFEQFGTEFKKLYTAAFGLTKNDRGDRTSYGISTIRKN